MGGFATVADGPIVAGSPFAVPDLVRYPVDLKKSAALLDEGEVAVAAFDRCIRSELPASLCLAPQEQPAALQT